jgi:hypothetical protein
MYILFPSMDSKFLTFALITSVLVFGTLNMMNSAFAQTPEWYPGEGIKQDMYVKYSIEDYDTARSGWQLDSPCLCRS